MRLSRNVVLASPSTLLAVLKSVAFTWRQDVLTDSARELFELARQLYERMGTLGENVGKLGSSLKSSVDRYNSMIGTLEARILPTARKLNAMDESGLPRPPALEVTPARSAPGCSPELQRGRGRGALTLPPRPGQLRGPASAERPADVAGFLEGCAELLGQGEEQVLLGRDNFLHGAVAVVGEQPQDVLDQHLGHGSSGGDADRRHAFKPGLVHFVGKVHAVGRLRAVLQRNFHQPHRVRGVGRPHHDDQVRLGRDLLDGHLAVGGGVADVVAGRILEGGEPFLEEPDGLHGLVNAEGGLGQPDDLFRIPDGHLVHLVRAVDDLDVFRGFARGSFNFLMAVVADEEDVEVVLGEPDGFLVDLCHQRAGGIDGAQPAVLGGLDHGG